MEVDRMASRELVERLWADVRRREEALAELPPITAPELGFSLYLRHVNHNWRVGELTDPFAGSQSFKHRVASRLARLVIHVLAPYLQRDEEFRAHMVRVANDAAEAHDTLLREVRALRAAIEDRTVRLSERIDAVARSADGEGEFVS